MKTSSWRVAALLANVAVICLAHPDGGHSGKRHNAEVSGDHLPISDARRNGIDVLLMTRNEGGNIFPNDARRRDIDVVKTSNTEGHARMEAAGRQSKVASSRASHSKSAQGRGSVATAMINFSLGGPIRKSGRYRALNSVNVGEKHNGRGSVNVQSSHGGGKEYNNQDNVDGIQLGLNSYSEVNNGGGNSGGGRERYDGVNIVGGNEGFGYTEPESEHSSGGYDGGLDDHIESVHNVRSAGDYNSQVDIGGIVGGNNGYDEISTSGVFEGVEGNFGDKFNDGRGVGFSGNNVDGGGSFGYNDIENEQNSLGYKEGIHSGDGGRGSNGGKYNIANVNGAPALVGGGVGGVYLSQTSNEGAYSAPGFVDEVSEGGYSTHEDNGGDISAGGYSDPEVNGVKGSGFYTPPVFDGRGQFGSIIQSGILQAEYSASDDSGGYGGTIGNGGSGY